MYWNRAHWLPRTLQCRLTLWFAGLFGCLSLLAFVAVDAVLRSSLQTRQDERLMSRAREYEAIYREYGVPALQGEFRREADTVGAENLLLVFRSPALDVLASSDLNPWEGMPLTAPGRSDLPGGEAAFRTRHWGPLGADIRMVEARTSDGYLLQVGETVTHDLRLVRRYRTTYGAVLVLMVAFGTSLGWLLTRHAMADVERVTVAATRIGNHDLALRVTPGRSGEEIRRLAAAFNDMLDRIDRLVRELREVTSNVAHDLRSPLTRIRAAAESLLAGDAAGQDKALAAAVVEECDRLAAMIDATLEIARVEAGTHRFACEPVDLAHVTRDAVELFLPVAESRHLSLEADLPVGPLVTHGSLPALQRVVANLIDNALKYTPAGGRVTVRVAAAAAGLEVRVADTGVGVPAAQHERIFERFYRGDASRSTPGNGLGLPLARALARAHGGDIRVESVPGQGSAFTVWLPGTAGTSQSAQGAAP